MSKENNKSVIINIPKKRVYSEMFVSSFNMKKHQVTTKYKSKLSDVVLKYTLPHEISLPITKLKQPEIILPFRQFCKQQDKNLFKQRLDISIYEKYKIIYADLHRRLYVDNPANDVYSVIDVDADYYRFSEGRPLPIFYPCYKFLKEPINKILQFKLESGIKNDCILNIETNYRNEIDIYDLTVERLIDQAKYFDEFISEDYKNSMKFLSKWDKIKHLIDFKIKELQNLAIEKFTLKSRLIGLESKYSVQLKYGRFLYYLSPPIWRLTNREFARSVEIEAKGFDYGNSYDEGTFAMIFENLRKICYGTPIRPALYFTEPNDLKNVFKAMENQQLHYYTHINHLTPHIKKLKVEINSVKEDISQDYAVLINLINKYENHVNYSEERCAELEFKFYKILFGLFYDTVAGTDVLKLFSHLGFCYEKVFYEKPSHLDIVAVAKSIEKNYMDYSKRLDKIQSKTVRRAMLKCVETERLQTKKANHAVKELRLFHRLESELLRAYDINKDNLYISIKRNSKKNIAKLKDSSRVPLTEVRERKTLTEVEIEFLLLFTDWTVNEDPANYLQSLTFNEHEYEHK